MRRLMIRRRTIVTEHCPHCDCPIVEDVVTDCGPGYVAEHRRCIMCGWYQDTFDYPPPEALVEEAKKVIGSDYFVVTNADGERLPWDIPNKDVATKLAEYCGGTLSSWRIDEDWDGTLPVPFYVHCGACGKAIPAPNVSDDRIGSDTCLLNQEELCPHLTSTPPPCGS